MSKKALTWILVLVLTAVLAVPTFAAEQKDIASVVQVQKVSGTAVSGAKTKITSVTLKHAYKVYTGTARTQTDTTVVKAGSKILKKGRDYIITYKNNVDVGKATLTVTGKGSYTGTISKTFYIYPKITAQQLGGSGTNRYCKITATGKKTVWTKTTPQRRGTQLLRAGGLGYNGLGMYYYYDEDTVYAVDILTGKQRWAYKSSNIGGSAQAFCHVSGKIFLVSGLAGNPIVILDKNGKLIRTINWRCNNKYIWPGPIRVKDGWIYMGASKQVGSSLREVTLKIHPSTGKVTEV